MADHGPRRREPPVGPDDRSTNIKPATEQGHSTEQEGPLPGDRSRAIRTVLYPNTTIRVQFHRRHGWQFGQPRVLDRDLTRLTMNIERPSQIMVRFRLELTPPFRVSAAGCADRPQAHYARSIRRIACGIRQ